MRRMARQLRLPRGPLLLRTFRRLSAATDSTRLSGWLSIVCLKQTFVRRVDENRLRPCFRKLSRKRGSFPLGQTPGARITERVAEMQIAHRA
jgi:hypothetical protein